jgi:hypothetical protein
MPYDQGGNWSPGIIYDQGGNPGVDQPPDWWGKDRRQAGVRTTPATLIYKRQSPLPHTAVRRGKIKRRDEDLHTQRLSGAGWTWDCTCGDCGTWYATRPEASEALRLHRLYKHGQR